jgi:hypothetical protein
MNHVPWLLLLGAALTGCATTQALHVESSASAIRSAEEHGAADVPQASLHLQLAKEELKKATDLNADGDADEAKSMLMRAEADAELAIELSHVAAERAEAEAAMERVRALRAANPTRGAR